MSTNLQRVPVQEAYDDLLHRTLSRISSDLGRLIYLASTRDYNSGNYHHEGLADRFSEEVARKALEDAHRGFFYRVSGQSLEDLAEELEIYLRSSREDAGTFLRTWHKLEPYRIAIPTDVDPTVERLFLCNVRLALAILRLRQEPNPLRQ
ncbi:MAG TPA: hypothetical protein VOA64_04300 [Candidatus Dormibacteraeota bacterium]|nr:hypothetical protein [Candidatus Dormibacteraeota bacterium]